MYLFILYTYIFIYIHRCRLIRKRVWDWESETYYLFRHPPDSWNCFLIHCGFLLVPPAPNLMVWSFVALSSQSVFAGSAGANLDSFFWRLRCQARCLENSLWRWLFSGVLQASPAPNLMCLVQRYAELSMCFCRLRWCQTGLVFAGASGAKLDA